MELLINIDVDNLDKAIEFYQRACGLRLNRRLFGNSVAEMLGTAAPVYLLAKDAGSPASINSRQLRDYHRHWTPVHLDFVVEDLEGALESAAAAGAIIESMPQSFTWGRLALLSDPFGNGFCFLQWSAGGYDAVVD
ncbi:MAG TPA: VOC family protein [Verrucomicrobiae bacterium]|nr:VOC family protein [Verrucomicrobiae bacterium]